jgi:ABC-type amino acid transport system permease subunit
VNTNLIHNILNILMIVVAGLAGFDFVGLGLDPILAGKIVAGLGTAKMIINVIRDGFSGLTKQQPPVQ